MSELSHPAEEILRLSQLLDGTFLMRFGVIVTAMAAVFNYLAVLIATCRCSRLYN